MVKSGDFAACINTYEALGSFIFPNYCVYLALPVYFHVALSIVTAASSELHTFIVLRLVYSMERVYYKRHTRKRPPVMQPPHHYI